MVYKGSFPHSLLSTSKLTMTQTRSRLSGITFPDMQHGWSCRGDLSLPEVKRDTELAMKHMAPRLKLRGRIHGFSVRPSCWSKTQLPTRVCQKKAAVLGCLKRNRKKPIVIAWAWVPVGHTVLVTKMIDRCILRWDVVSLGLGFMASAERVLVTLMHRG